MSKLTMSSAIILAATFMLPGGVFGAPNDTQSLSLNDKVEVPGAELKAGSYTFSVEDRLRDRAIVRIANASGDQHFLLLAVPNGKISATSKGLLFFTNSKDSSKQVLKAWNCPNCAIPLEFVYPKLEAVKITDASTEPVLAVDPTYDKLPSNLSADDMKVVTLWLLSPERITAENVGEGVKAVKYAPGAVTPISPSEAASAAAASAPASEPAQTAANVSPSEQPSTSAGAASRPHHNRLPKTASNTYLFGLCGLLSLAVGLCLRARRLRTAASQ